MTRLPGPLADVCREKLLEEKWLVAPSRSIGNQWIETLVRNGNSAVNLHPTTVLYLALDLVASDMAKEGLTLASHAAGTLIVKGIWKRLSPEGYLGRMEQSADLSTAVCASLRALRMAGCTADSIGQAQLENTEKAEDIIVLLTAYEEFCRANAIVDDADVLQRAIAQLKADPDSICRDKLVLIPSDPDVTGLERALLDALPDSSRITIAHLADLAGANDRTSDIQLLANIGKKAEGIAPTGDGSVQFLRAIGEVNEIREALRRCLAEEVPLDELELLYSDAETYLPLIYATARRYFSQPDRPDGVPVTFADGIPASLSRPGRAVTVWLYWMWEGYPQRLLVEMIGDGLLNLGGEGELSLSYLMRLLRPISIGSGADNYLPKLKEQIDSLRNSEAEHPDDRQRRERKLKGLQALRRMIRRLLDLSHRTAGSGTTILDVAEEFLLKHTRSVSELDELATEALIGQLKERRLWLQRLSVTFDLEDWIATLPSQTRVLRSGPRSGHLHVAHVGAGGQSGRERTIVVGLDDRRFPGTNLQDPILLDHERRSVNPELPTGAEQPRRKVLELATNLARVPTSVTLCWPCQDLTDDRETFPSSFVLSAYRLISGNHHADLEALNSAVGPPVSFAPTAANKALDVTERWLWRLSADEAQGASQLDLVEAFYPHLKRGRAARSQPPGEFGPFDGYVPQAGEDLDPFSADGPVLSASALETAGRCPLAFFFRYALKLYPPDELELDPDRWIDPAQFGLLLHDVFRRFMSELTSRGERPRFERDHNRLAEILRAAVQQWRESIVPPNENAFRMQYWQLVRSCRIFLQDEEIHCLASQPRYFEVALGVDSVGGGTSLDCQEASTVELPGSGVVRAKGQIDRVDQTANAEYSVWDYKISSGYGYDLANPFRQGRRVQSVLYLQLMQTALRGSLNPKATVERFGYFFPSIRAHGHRIAWDARTLQAGMEVLEKLCANIREGAFLATENEDDCAYCDYAPVCRDVKQVTSRSKELLGRADLSQLKHFRELRCG